MSITTLSKGTPKIQPRDAALDLLHQILTGPNYLRPLTKREARALLEILQQAEMTNQEIAVCLQILSRQPL